MKTLNLVQGSDEWHAARSQHFCASEAPAMKGESRYTSRNQLLDTKKGKKESPVSDHQQKIFDRGHKAEDDARSALEAEHLTLYPAVVGTIEIEGMHLLASFDGLEGGEAGAMIWEHKLWNETLAENVRNQVLEPMYYWQLEHQMLVNGSDQAIFMVSDGTYQNREWMIYESVPERRKELIAGWKQFKIDLESHELKAKTEKVEAAKTDLPAITATVSSGLITTNIDQVLVSVKALSEKEMQKTLESDQDFADKDQLNKDVKKAREALKVIVSNIQSEFATFSDFSAVADQVDSVLQKLQSHGEKLVKTEKQRRKEAICKAANQDLQEEVFKLNQELFGIDIQAVIQAYPDYESAMKNKRTLESIQNAVDEANAKAKIELNQAFEVIQPNLQYVEDNHADFKFLLHDIANICNQSSEGFQALVDKRVSDHKQAEADRIERERQQKEAAEKEAAERDAEAAHEWAGREKQPQQESESGMVSTGQNELIPMTDDIAGNVDQHADEPIIDITVAVPQSKVEAFRNFILNNFNCTIHEDSDDISIY